MPDRNLGMAVRSGHASSRAARTNWNRDCAVEPRFSKIRARNIHVHPRVSPVDRGSWEDSNDFTCDSAALEIN